MRNLLLLFPILLFGISYEVNFVGLDNKRALDSLKDISDLVHLQNRPPASINGLRYRIAGDIPDMLKTLRAYGYYDASITSDLETNQEQILVTVHILPGPQYTIHSYEVYSQDCTVEADISPCAPFTPESLGIQLEGPALSTAIVNAELNLLTDLARCGYPLAKIKKRKVIVDMQDKYVEAATCVEEGPLSKFGPTSVFGLKSVKPTFILKRMAWEEGALYSTDCVEETQKRLLNSDLFSSVLITHGDALDPNGELPMKLRLSEAKHKQITLGAFYATVDGPGGALTWTNRNFRGLGETVALDAEFSKRYLSGTLSYKKPDLFMLDQAYRALVQIERQDIRPYTANIYRFANYLEQKFNNRHDFTIGFELQHFNVTHSANDGTYLLFDVPLFARYNTAEDLFNPTKGYSIVYQPQFFQSLEKGSEQFLKQRLTTTFYLPFIKKWLIFAGRVQVGSILGTKQRNIPLPVLFLGGSEDDLRGYRYLTVSPLDSQNRPLGGRSAIFLTAEMRLRFGEHIGLVPFADFGTVSFSELPTVDAKWFKSVGLGLRYFTFFGPLRFDVGFPLDRRRGIDPSYRIYASIGQSF